jgi:PEP-CTERM motif
MRSKKRVLVTAFGATVALAVQTPVSAFIVSSRKAAVATAVAHHNPPSYLADAFSDAGRRVLRADRWNGWRAADSALADDLESAPVHQAQIDSTLGGLDLGDLGAGAAAQGRNSSMAAASGDSPTANASFTGGGGSGGGAGGGGIGGAGGGGGAGGVGASGEADGLSVGDAPSGSLLAAGNASSNGLAAGAFGTLPGVSAGPGVLVITNPANGLPVNTPAPVAVESPEPGTLLFLGAGLAGLAARRVRRTRSGRGQPAIR